MKKTEFVHVESIKGFFYAFLANLGQNICYMLNWHVYFFYNNVQTVSVCGDIYPDYQVVLFSYRHQPSKLQLHNTLHGRLNR